MKKQFLSVWKWHHKNIPRGPNGPPLVGLRLSNQWQDLYGMIWNAQTLIDFDNRMTHHKQISKRYFDV